MWDVLLGALIMIFGILIGVSIAEANMKKLIELNKYDRHSGGKL